MSAHQRQSAGVPAGAVVAGVSRWCLQMRALGIAVGDPDVAGLGGWRGPVGRCWWSLIGVEW
jgi:hypothetical protein